eukprot:gb/GECG01008898.1/.p1 GENE.gb/GECG01008898.1/~~gb/GECG01008898.1/.p1  ORF type:complete len:658 (+),score=55.78 gb/GECG01008898.1/:1-1974(+)
MGCHGSKPTAVFPVDSNKDRDTVDVQPHIQDKNACENLVEFPFSRGARASKPEEYDAEIVGEEPRKELSEGADDNPSIWGSIDPVYNANEPFVHVFQLKRNHSMPYLKGRTQNDPSAAETKLKVDPRETAHTHSFGNAHSESPKDGSDRSLRGEHKNRQVSGSLIELDVSPNVYDSIVNGCVFCKTEEARKRGYKLMRHHSLAEVNPRQYTSSGCDLDKLPTCVCTECRQEIVARCRKSRRQPERQNPTSKGKHARSRVSPWRHAAQKGHSPPPRSRKIEKSQNRQNRAEQRRRRHMDPERAMRLRHEAAGFFLKKGMKVEDYYEFSETIGKGRFGTIFKGVNKVTGQEVALKRIDLTATQTEYVLAELQCLVSRHASFVRLIELYEEGNYLWMVMELMRTELLSELMDKGPFSEPRARNLMIVVTRGLRFLHQNLYVHRDLKPENILIGFNNEFKLADFGLARQLKAYQDGSVESLSGTCGTWAYNAPEMRGRGETYGRSADIWALGVILFIVLSGYHAFDPEGKGQKERIIDAVLRNQWSFGDKCWRRVSSDAKDLIGWMLARNPADRPSPSEVLSHPWFAISGSNLNARFTRSEADVQGGAAVQRFRPSQTGSYPHSNCSSSAYASPTPGSGNGRGSPTGFSEAILETGRDVTG